MESIPAKQSDLFSDSTPVIFVIVFIFGRIPTTRDLVVKKMVLERFRQALQNEVRLCILPYWMYKATDQQNGGYWGSIDSNGTIDKMAPKGAILHARILWTFAHAYQQFPDPGYEYHARRTHRFIQRKLLDSSTGAVLWQDMPPQKCEDAEQQLVASAYWLYGKSEYVRAFSSEEDKAQLTQVWQQLFCQFEKMLEAPLSQQFSWRTWLHIIEATDNYARLELDPLAMELMPRLLRLAIQLVNATELEQLNIPHRCATAWMLMKWVSRWLPEAKTRAVELAGQLVELAIKDGLQENNGFAYEASDSAQFGWVQAEAMLACWRYFQATGDKKYQQIALKCWDFIQSHISDKNLGEWHWSYSSQTQQQEKVGFWKCPYHNSRACLEIFQDLSSLGIT